MPFSRRRLFPVAILVAVGSLRRQQPRRMPLLASTSSAERRRCLQAVRPAPRRRPARGEARVQDPFRRPRCPSPASRAADRSARCSGRDGSRFARLYSDSRDRHVLEVAFFRPSGVLRSAVDTRYAVTPAETGVGREVRQLIPGGRSRTTVLGGTTRQWWIGATVRHRTATTVVEACPERAERVDEQHQLVRHRGPGEPARAVRGQDLWRSQARRLQHRSTGAA